ncbi:hypothetical protein TNCV_2141651 [Trichonephila clavipes]|uniref:Uncharacterized protein n=1 Tax=Trichonephila clavipes TaxID=2585209 RepID=A0A8X6VAF3_TRICX|nr:hypothetical protein TNCV_2141651 [Trichonephila clavipes]
MNRISTCSSNLVRYKREPFLDHLVTGDVKWIVYKHVVKKVHVYKEETPPSTSKAGVHQKKVMLCWTATAGSDEVQSGSPIFDDFFQHLWLYIGNDTANVVFQIVKRLCLILIDQ